MENTIETAAKRIDQIDQDLSSAISSSTPTFSGFEHKLAELRSACEDFLFLNFDAATQQNVETRLWDAHGKVNRKFRPYLASFREGEGKKKHVERRKAEKLYLDFIKSSMRFYRGYIQRLALHFQNVPELFDIGRTFGLNTLLPNATLVVNAEQKRSIIHSCHASLIQLGDLSRYRETELKVKERNWGPAKGYYDLAITIDPSSGMSYNQLAVIAFAEKDHLRAVYYLYRALCVESPAPTALGNLELEFKKIRHRRSKKSSDLSSENLTTNSELHSQFLAFHAYRLAEDGYSGKDEMQSEIFRVLADAIRESSNDHSIRRMCLINIAAEHCSKVVATESQRNFQVYQVLQRFNVATFFILLKLLLDELQLFVKSKDVTTDKTIENASDISPVTRRLLPNLRLYSAWLMTNMQFLLVQRTDALRIQVQELWQVYVEALNLLISTFSLRNLPELPYLLEEDEDTLSFSAFSDTARKRRYANTAGHMKSARNQETNQQIDEEMLYRIKDLVTDGLYLNRKKNEFGGIPVPLLFGQGRFFYEGDTATKPTPSTQVGSSHSHVSSVGSITRDDIDSARRTGSQGFAGGNSKRLDDEAVMSVSASANSTMESMVNDLVQSEASEPLPEDGLPTPTLRKPGMATFPESDTNQRRSGAFTAQDLVQQFHQPSANDSIIPMGRTPSGHPVLPSVWNTPFAPQIGETSGTYSVSTASHAIGFGQTTHVQQSSGAVFQNELSKKQRQLQLRSSPLLSMQPSTPSYYHSPNGLQSRMRQDDQASPRGSPWQSSPIPTQDSSANLPRRLPQAALFGAIGEARPSQGRTPTSGQFG